MTIMYYIVNFYQFPMGFQGGMWLRGGDSVIQLIITNVISSTHMDPYASKLSI